MNENAVLILLKRPALGFVRETRQKLDSDPSYLEEHRGELLPTVQDFLLKGGVFWDPEILEREAMKILEAAIARLRQIEK